MKKALIGIMIVSLMGGCAVVNRSYKLGNSSEINKQWDEAIAHYEKAVIENPKESVYRLALLRVKASAAMAALENARLLSLQGKKEEAAAAYRKALTYDPTNRLALTELEILTAPPSAVKEKSKPAPDVFELPVRLKVNDEKIQLKFTEASVRSIFLALGRHAGVNFIFDEQFRDVPLTIDLMDRTFDKALDFLCLASKNFSRIIDERTVIIVPDTPMTRMAYEWNAIKTFYLSNLNAQDVMNSLTNMVRTNIKQPILIMDKNLNSITIRDTPRTIALAEKLIRSWDKFRGEVVIDLEIMEVSRIREKDLGLNFSQSYANIQYDGNGTINESGQVPLKGLNLGKAENYLIGLPEVALKFLETDSDTKIIAQPRLRGIGSEEIKYVVGQQVPFTNTSFVPISSGGVNQQTVTSYEYKNVGIDVKIKPRIHIEEREVTLDLEIKITSLTETSISGIPIISTREIKNVIRLKDGETNLLAGLLKDEERQTLKGVTGVKHIPILGSLFSSTDRTVEQTDVILTITPTSSGPCLSPKRTRNPFGSRIREFRPAGWRRASRKGRP